MSENEVKGRDEPAICRIRRVVTALRFVWIHDRRSYRYLVTDYWDEIMRCVDSEN